MSQPSNDNGRGRPCRIFEESARLGGQFTLRDTGITVAKILEEVDRNGADAVLARYEGRITARDIDLCRTIAAHHMPEREEYRQNGSSGALAILLDENMPHRLIPRALNENSRLVHISFKQLTTLSDPVIWRFAKKNRFAALMTSDSDFVHMVEMETLDRLRKAGSFAGTHIQDLPFVVFLTGAARHGHLMDETRLRTAITGIANEAARDGRRLAYAVIDENGLRPGLTVEDIYARYVRPSIAGTAMEKPVFDRSIMDHNAINTLRQKCGMTLMRFTAEPEWKEFYNRTYDSITRSRQQNGPSARPF